MSLILQWRMQNIHACMLQCVWNVVCMCTWYSQASHICVNEPYMCKRVCVYVYAQLKHAIAVAKAMDMHACVRHEWTCTRAYGVCFHVWPPPAWSSTSFILWLTFVSWALALSISWSSSSIIAAWTWSSCCWSIAMPAGRQEGRRERETMRV